MGELLKRRGAAAAALIAGLASGGGPAAAADAERVAARDLRRVVAEASQGARTRAVSVRWVDLNRDGRRDAIVQVVDTRNCRSAGCATYVFLGESGRTVRRIDAHYLFGAGDPTVLRETCNGFRMIQTGRQATRWCWTGARYEPVRGAA